MKVRRRESKSVNEAAEKDKRMSWQQRKEWKKFKN